MKTSVTQILVHMDGTGRSADRLVLARAIAADQGASVTALYAVTPSLLEVPYAAEAGAGAITALREIDEDRRGAARALFDRVRATPGVSVAWAEADWPIMPAFSQQALYADLLLLGQYDKSDPASAGVPRDFAETAMAMSGKAALVLPCEGALATVGKNVVIAWKPTREAGRAVSAALPLLQRAKKVHVLSWAAEGEAVKGDRLDLQGFLNLHGIEPVWHRETSSEPEYLGELLLSRAFDLEADLLVMGCYGHSRTREWVLGGTSRTILRSMTLPVLMAH